MGEAGKSLLGKGKKQHKKTIAKIPLRWVERKMCYPTKLSFLLHCICTCIFRYLVICSLAGS